MKGISWGCGTAIICAVSFFTVPVPARAAPAPAPTPGAVQSTLPANPSVSKPAPAPGVQTPAAIMPGVEPGGPAVRVQRFDIIGNAVFSDAVLQAQISHYLGQRLTLTQLYDVADALTRYYRARGYGLAYVSLPAQTLKDGAIRLQVVEGRIGSISMRGNARTGTATLKKRVSNLTPGMVYTDADMERAVLLLNDLPGMQAHAVLSPGAQFGTSDVLFNLQETPYSGDLSVDDYGRSDIGRWRFSADAVLNSFTGHGDQFTAGITHSESNLLNFGKLAYSLPLGPAGGTLTAGFNRAEYHVGGSLFGPLDISGSTENGSLNYLYPAVRTREESFYWGFGFSHNTSKANTGSTQITTTNINLLQLTTFYVNNHPDNSYYTLGGNLWTNGKSNDGTSNSAEKLRIEVDGSYFKPFSERWNFIGQASLEYSPDPLVDTDKYSLGGPDSVRGFLPAEQRGDRGAFTSLEVQRSFSIGSLPWAVGGYLDSGKVWTKATPTVPGSNVTLTSVGTELLLFQTTGNRWNARLQWAYAVGGYRPSDGNEGGHIWFTLGMKF